MTGTRPDGIVSRTATAADAEEVLALIGARSGPEDVPEAEAAFIDGQDGFKRWLVAADGPRIVAVLALWEERVRVGETWLQAGQIDFVATASGYGRRGLMRGLIDEAHVRCAARRDALQIMLGIPYFYRQFGYSYTVPIPVTHEVPPRCEARAAHRCARAAGHRRRSARTPSSAGGGAAGAAGP